ncbi:MAG: hypothetical protein ABUS56_13460, partial [Acidobacteriota bacterium]
MGSRQTRRGRIWALTAGALAAFAVTLANPAAAQEVSRPSRLGYAVKGVLFDPTTYAPALLSLDATLRDWRTSQPFFANGYVEKNARFT